MQLVDAIDGSLPVIPARATVRTVEGPGIGFNDECRSEFRETLATSSRRVGTVHAAHPVGRIRAEIAQTSRRPLLGIARPGIGHGPSGAD